MPSASSVAADTRRQIWLLFGTIFLVMIGFGIVLPILPFLAKRFGASPVQMGLLITGWSVAQFVAAPVWGILAERLGRKPVLVAGLVGYILAFAGMAFAESYAVLLAARVLGGLLSSSVLPAGQAIAADLSPPRERGAVMGLLGAGFGTGFLVGPAVGGVLAVFGPRAPFFAAAVASLAALPLVARWVREPPADARRAAAASLGAAGILRALASPERPLFLMAFASTFGGSSLFSMLGYYAIDRAGASPSSVGVIFTSMGLGSVISQMVLMGPVTRRWGEAQVIRAGFSGAALGFLGVAVAGTVETMAVAVCLGSVAMALIRPSLVALNSRTTTQGYAVSLGLQASFDSLGRTLGPLWAGTVYPLTPVAPFVAAAIVYALAAMGTLRLPQAHPAPGPMP